MSRHVIPLEGTRFGHVRVLKRTRERSRGSVVWECECDCGAQFTRRSWALIARRKAGYTQFCCAQCPLRWQSQTLLLQHANLTERVTQLESKLKEVTEKIVEVVADIRRTADETEAHFGVDVAEAETKLMRGIADLVAERLGVKS